MIPMLRWPPSRQVCSLSSHGGRALNLFRHVQMDFWPQFCAKAGVFCMGEVFGGLEVEYVVVCPSAMIQ